MSTVRENGCIKGPVASVPTDTISIFGPYPAAAEDGEAFFGTVPDRRQTDLDKRVAAILPAAPKRVLQCNDRRWYGSIRGLPAGGPIIEVRTDVMQMDD